MFVGQFKVLNRMGDREHEVLAFYCRKCYDGRDSTHRDDDSKERLNGAHDEQTEGKPEEAEINLRMK